MAYMVVTLVRAYIITRSAWSSRITDSTSAAFTPLSYFDLLNYGATRSELACFDAWCDLAPVLWLTIYIINSSWQAKVIEYPSFLSHFDMTDNELIIG